MAEPSAEIWVTKMSNRFGGEMRTVLNILTLRYLLDTQLEMTRGSFFDESGIWGKALFVCLFFKDKLLYSHRCGMKLKLG